MALSGGMVRCKQEMFTVIFVSMNISPAVLLKAHNHMAQLREDTDHGQQQRKDHQVNKVYLRKIEGLLRLAENSQSPGPIGLHNAGEGVEARAWERAGDVV